MKKLYLSVLFLLLFVPSVFAGFQEHYNAGQVYLAQYQYSSAISEFKKALRINYLDTSARVGLINSYLARATFFANTDKNYDAAANDFRAALFYLKYYPDEEEVKKSAQNIDTVTKNLSKCMSEIKADKSPEARYKKGQQLRLKGLFAEAGYEFAQSLDSYSYRGSAFEQIGDMMKVLGNVDKVAYYYKKALEYNPDLADLRLKYARALDKQGHGELALDEYNSALQNGDNDPETLYSLERIYRQKLLQNDNDANALTNLGAILQKQNKYDEALKYYSLAEKAEPDNLQNRMNLASLFYAKKEYNKALNIYDNITISHPRDVYATLYKGECQIALGYTDEAIKTFQEVLRLSEDNKIKSQIVNSLKGKMSPDEIIAFVYNDSIPQKADLDNLYSYAYNLHKANKLDKAIDCYKTVLKYNKQNPEVYVNLAIAYNQNKNYEEAQNIIKDAKAKFPANKQILEISNSLLAESSDRTLTKAAEYFNKQDYENALNTYKTLQTYDAYIGCAMCYSALKDDANALEYYKKAFGKKENSEIAYYIAALYSNKGDYENAKLYLNKSLALNSANTDAKELLNYVNSQQSSGLLNEGMALYEQGRYNEALNVFNKIIQADAKNAYAYYYRATIFDATQKYAKAIPDYQKALLYSSDLGIANYLIAVDYDSMGQYKNALTYFKKYVASTSEDNEYKAYAQKRIGALKAYE